MHIYLKYNSSWRNSFLDGSNNQPLPQKGRKFIGTQKGLSTRVDDKYPNFIGREITIDTVMGILNRLIGDQRKLYQSRSSEKYFFKEIEPKISFKDIPSVISSEIVFLRNVSGATDQNSFAGMIKANDPIFTSDYSGALWGILMLDFVQLCEFISDTGFAIENKNQFDPLMILNQLNLLDKQKPVPVKDKTEKALTVLNAIYPDEEYLDKKEMVKPIMFYCAALYLQISRLKKHFDLSGVVTKKDGISGISKRGFTGRDFMARFTTGDRKIIWGGPYLLKERSKAGEKVSNLTKADGIIEITLDVPDEQSAQIKEMIENAGVSSFYLGKKGLAYVDQIWI